MMSTANKRAESYSNAFVLACTWMAKKANNRNIFFSVTCHRTNDNHSLSFKVGLTVRPEGVCHKNSDNFRPLTDEMKLFGVRSGQQTLAGVGDFATSWHQREIVCHDENWHTRANRRIKCCHQITWQNKWKFPALIKHCLRTPSRVQPWPDKTRRSLFPPQRRYKLHYIWLC